MTLARSGLSFSGVFRKERLECRIAANRVPRRIHSKALQCHSRWATQQTVQYLDRASVISEDRVDLRNVLRHLRALERIFALRSQIGRSLRFCDGRILFAKLRKNFS